MNNRLSFLSCKFEKICLSQLKEKRVQKAEFDRLSLNKLKEAVNEDIEETSSAMLRFEEQSRRAISQQSYNSKLRHLLKKALIFINYVSDGKIDISLFEKKIEQIKSEAEDEANIYGTKINLDDLRIFRLIEDILNPPYSYERVKQNDDEIPPTLRSPGVK